MGDGKTLVSEWMDAWIDGWIDGWMTAIGLINGSNSLRLQIVRLSVSVYHNQTLDGCVNVRVQDGASQADGSTCVDGVIMTDEAWQRCSL